jgi:hypothetical protein
MLQSGSAQAERDILRSARFQHSSLTQSVKQDAIERIIEQCLGLSTDPMSIEDMVNASSLEINGGIQILRTLETKDAVDRLRKTGRLSVSRTSGEKYTLTKKARHEFHNAKIESERRARKITNRLFRNRVTDPDSMTAPFFEMLGKVFSQLSGTYINILRGQESKSVLLSAKELSTAADEVVNKYSISEERYFRRAIEEFFEQSDPDFDTVKWNLAQNYYISLALGLDPSGSLLSKELFDAGYIYLDTNVIIHGVEPLASHNASFRALVRMCKRMSVTLCVWSETLNELSRVVDHYMKVVPVAALKVPDKTIPKVGNIFYRLYNNALKKESNPALFALYASFINARAILEDEYEVSIDTDDWFDRMKKDKAVLTSISTVLN